MVLEWDGLARLPPGEAVLILHRDEIQKVPGTCWRTLEESFEPPVSFANIEARIRELEKQVQPPGCGRRYIYLWTRRTHERE
jgi:hypothetical protein